MSGFAKAARTCAIRRSDGWAIGGGDDFCGVFVFNRYRGNEAEGASDRSAIQGTSPPLNAVHLKSNFVSSHWQFVLRPPITVLLVWPFPGLSQWTRGWPYDAVKILEQHFVSVGLDVKMKSAPAPLVQQIGQMFSYRCHRPSRTSTA